MKAFLLTVALCGVPACAVIAAPDRLPREVSVDEVLGGHLLGYGDAEGRPRPAKGDRQLLVRIVGMNDPARARDYASRPSIRLDTDFKILLVPHRAGDAVSVTTWNADRTELAVTIGERTDALRCAPGADGRTRIAFVRSATTFLICT